jgi:ATPase subunit of ABC transporter with duplicated ATPase domains
MIDSINTFEGGVIMVTHNEYILHRIANKLIVFQHDRAFHFQGNYSQFLEQIGWDDQESIKFGKKSHKRHGESVKAVNRKDTRKARAEFVTRRSKALTPYKKKIEKLEKDIEEMEQQLHNDNEFLIKASQEQDKNTITALSRSVKQTQAGIDTLYKQLEETTEKYEQEKLAFKQEEISL